MGFRGDRLLGACAGLALVFVGASPAWADDARSDAEKRSALAALKMSAQTQSAKQEQTRQAFFANRAAETAYWTATHEANQDRELASLLLYALAAPVGFGTAAVGIVMLAGDEEDVSGPATAAIVGGAVVGVASIVGAVLIVRDTKDVPPEFLPKQARTRSLPATALPRTLFVPLLNVAF